MSQLLPSKRLCYLLLVLLAGGCMLNLFLQAASLGMNLFSAVLWVSAYPWLYCAGSLFLFCILIIGSVIVPNPYTGPAVVSIVFLLLGITGYEKLATTGEPLFPWDLMLVKNAAGMSKITRGMISPLVLVASVIMVAVLVFLIVKLPKIKAGFLLRMGMGGMAMALAAGFLVLVSGQSPVIAALKYQNIFWNQKVNYTQNGFLFAFAGNLRQNLLEKPEGYSREAVEAAAAKYAALPDSQATAIPAEQPNILFMMDEAFFDPTRLPGYMFSEDPLAFIHGEDNKTPSGFLLSPEFGGNTANVEFEALTGLSMYFLGDGTIPYQQRLVKMSSLPSIVSILKERGYQALALHPFDETFYNRNTVYPVLGFERFTSEKDLPDAARLTPDGYISDKAAVDEAVRELQAASGPVFLHLVTMQNHFPFTKGLNGPNTITVTGGQPEQKDELETYVQSTKLTDQALAYLQQELLKLKRPSIAVFWGDHLPALSAGIYTAAGWDQQPRLKHETKLMILANYDIGNEPLGTLSPAFLGPAVFGLSGQELPPFYKLLEQVKAELPGLSKQVLVGPGNSGVLSGLTAEQQRLLEDYRLIEYDLLEGEQYAKDLMF
ncbi:LTA synthase family protein [Paenibacillus sp. MMS20-IR301]|uniref:LTA synthase family protein n=1 Tax=Paenibacillus sp. MMS20-IR301 TaxID=2895946 RepID=UPI0028EECC42|nr:LTA synthase family protein [Paenibacillus sp. MMS20-IR301]WNS45731.1 LTA synthase family protein [Paenibacillus sp. MMS20-IR301]